MGGSACAQDTPPTELCQPEWLEYALNSVLHAGVVQNANPLNVPVSNMYKLLRMPDLAQRLKVYKESLALVRLKTAANAHRRRRRVLPSTLLS